METETYCAIYLASFCRISEIHLKNSIYTKKTSAMQTMVGALFESSSESSHLMSSHLISLSTLMSRSFTSLILAQGGPPTAKLNEHSPIVRFFYSSPNRSKQWGCDTWKSRFTVLVFSLESKISKMKTERSNCYIYFLNICVKFDKHYS